MGKKVFVSYSHAQFDWVSNRLAPLIRAGGAELIRDIDLGELGKAIPAQMDGWVDDSDVMLAVISPEYLSRPDSCGYEWRRAVARDPGFTQGRVVPILLSGKDLPPEVTIAHPLYADLTPDRFAEPDDAAVNLAWEKILHAIGGDLGVKPLAWLHALTRTVALVKNRQSVNLVASSPARWDKLLEEAVKALQGIPLVNLGDVENGHSKRCFLESLLGVLDASGALPDKPKGHEILDFTKRVRAGGYAQVAVAHFEKCWKWKDIDGAFFEALRTLTQPGVGRDRIDLTMVVHSTVAISTLPKHDPVSVWQPEEVILNRPKAGGK